MATGRWWGGGVEWAVSPGAGRIAGGGPPVSAGLVAAVSAGVGEDKGAGEGTAAGASAETPDAEASEEGVRTSARLRMTIQITTTANKIPASAR